MKSPAKAGLFFCPSGGNRPWWEPTLSAIPRVAGQFHARLGFALAFVVCGVAGELPGATLGATGGAVHWEGKPLRGRV